MQELEQKTYNYTVQTIGFIKSLEKELPHLVNEELRTTAGAVSLKFMDAMESIENKDFSDNIKKSFDNARRSFEILKTLNCSANKELEKQKAFLLSESHEIIEKLNFIISKLIY
ncbi:MAG: hypothetical protein A2X13_15080 [Bacteroidetes bacterium GWC2_33_15]|nr:MAG: hypothetical protein A2X10_07145 [Bacteroidetes bacterium GWA2_33_15]OFX50193.1 MAG: hypothetical protein A2X13_15080 [Bacteroidetes bacterium GWC2_33_15]OFX65345.1 MAG: hypothetical protein A2X15_04655 [Bacteroidetes bacterium GWB2_32_14]OFX70572.1 MAG: hypothetical protein A2X14_04710 [Bacteroidetes bacterium GWD2_33_33]HAN19554.1 hypothetical protein [Bacteroidales bacterium]